MTNVTRSKPARTPWLAPPSHGRAVDQGWRNPTHERPRGATLPTTVAGLKELYRHPVYTEAVRSAHSFRPRPTDVVVATYPKCGTTWVQQIMYGLCMRGAMDFEEISVVVPWIEVAPLVGTDLDRDQRTMPRLFKSHLPWDDIPKGCRYIHVMRDPADACLSCYHFFNGTRFERDSINANTFATEFWLQSMGVSGDYWDHLRSWWEQHGREDILFLSYAGMKRNHAEAVRRIAAFMGIDADPGLVAHATRQSTVEFMRAHEGKFDDHIDHRPFCIATGVGSQQLTKVRRGLVGESRRVLSAEVLTAIAARTAELPFTFRDDGSSVEARLGRRAV